MTPAEMVNMYIKLRDEKRRKDEDHKKACERLVQGMEKLEGLMLDHLNETGAQSIAVKDVGTVYRTVRTTASVADREKFLDWIAEDKWDALDAKANVTYIKELIEAGTAIPDFVKVSQIATIGVQRK